MGAIAVFDYVKWVALFPEFTAIPEATVLLYANTIAPALFINDGSGPVCDAGIQLSLLDLVVAHIAYLFAPAAQGGSGAANAGLVGRISSATEGSVSASATLGDLPASATFWAQSRYGLLFWQATAPYRTFRYRPPINTSYGDPFGNAYGLFPYGGGYPRLP